MCQDVFFCVSVWPSHSESLPESSHRPRHSEILEMGQLMPIYTGYSMMTLIIHFKLTSKRNPAKLMFIILCGFVV